MLKILRNQSPVLVAIILGVISLSFLVFFQLPMLQGLGRTTLGRIDGRNIGTDDFRDAQEGAYLLLMLEHGSSLPGGDETTALVDRMAWQRLMLLSAAAQLKITVSDAELADFIQSLPFLRKEGHYDPDLYDALVRALSASRGITEARFQEVLRENLIIEKTIRAVSAPAAVSAEEVDQLTSVRLGETKVIEVRLRAADLAPQIALTPADVDKEMQEHPDNPAYRSPERRSVIAVPFLLTAAQEKLPEKEKAAALRQLGARAADFSVTALDKAKDNSAAFRALAVSQGLTATTTTLFSRSEAPTGYEPSLSFNHAAFDLNSDIPISDAVETEHGYYVLKLAAIAPSALLPADKIRPLAMAALRTVRAQELVQARGQALAEALRVALAAGKPWAEAWKTATAAVPGITPQVESLPAFVPVEAAKGGADPAFLNVVGVSMMFQPGQSSPWVPNADGGFLIFVEKREAPAAALASTLRPRIALQALQNRRDALFADWFSARTKQADSKAPAFFTHSPQ